MFILIIIVPAFIIIIFTVYLLFFKENVQERINKAISLYKTGNIDIALNILKNITSKHKDIPMVHWYLADIYYQKKIYEIAEQECQKILALKKFTTEFSEADVRKKLAQIYWDDKKLDEAYKELILVSQIEPERADVYLDLGRLSIERKVYRDAIMYIEKYIKINPTNALAYLLLGEAYFYLQIYESAEINLMKALEIDNKLNKAHFFLGMIYSNKKSYDMALREFEYPQQDKTARFYIAFEKGRIYHEKGMYESAISEFKKALEIGGQEKNEEYDIKYAMAECYIKLGKIDDAIKYWEEIYRVNPQYRDVKDKLSMYKELKETDLFNKFLNAIDEEFIKIGQAIVESMNYDVIEYDLRKDGILDIVAFDKNKKTGENYLIEIIRFESEVGELILREMNSKMQDLQIYRGICITTSSFTDAAVTYTKNRAIELIDKDELNKILSRIKIII